MHNWNLENNEEIKEEIDVFLNDEKKSYHFVLTSKKIVLEKEKGLFKKKLKVQDIILLDDIRDNKDMAKRIDKIIEIRTNEKILKLTFDNVMESKKIYKLIVGKELSSLDKGDSKLKKIVKVVNDVKDIMLPIIEIVKSIKDLGDDD